MTDRTPSPLGLRISRNLLSGYQKHGLATEDMIHDCALLVDKHIEIDRLERELTATLESIDATH